MQNVLLGGTGGMALSERSFLCRELQTDQSAGTKVHLAGRKLKLRKAISHEEADPCRGVRIQLTAVLSLCPMTMVAETQAWFGGSLPAARKGWKG